MSSISSNSSKEKSGNTKQISPAKHWIFTLNNHTEKDILRLMNDSSIEQLSMQEETGESGTPHLQGYLKFKTKKRPLSIFKNDFKAHWILCKYPGKAIEYTQKEDTRTGRQFVKGLRIVRPLQCLNRSDLYPWQEEIVALTETIPDDRSIHWYWDSVGNIGKSALVRYLVIHKGALLVSGKSADIKYQIAQVLQPPDLIIYDIPRTAQGYINWTGLEEIKNGIFCSSKYESKMIMMNSPHIICFANFEPELSVMSQDRWKIRELSPPEAISTD